MILFLLLKVLVIGLIQMKNKVEFKKCIFFVLIICGLLTIVFMFINKYEYDTYRNNYNYKIEEIINVIKEKYPLVDEIEIIKVLNSEVINNELLLDKYGIDINDDDIILDNIKSYNGFKIVNISFMCFCFVLIIFIFVYYIFSKDKKIREITRLLERINNRDYALDIDSNTEDELSILKNELYKTTIMLKEQAMNESLDKINIKNSLEDISHQLKTPIASIKISLDNIIEKPYMDKNTRIKFINSINREVNNISFLVQSILKLSKFDANTIEFNRREVLVSDIINESIKNIELICDLKNVIVDVTGKDDITIFCDSKWQVEAITNVLKNAVEHSDDGGVIKILYSQNKVLTKIFINNKGNVIDKVDIPHVFDRFFKGKNSTSDSVGIGLSLSKTIILKDNGKIQVSSNIKDGTIFEIRYYKD